MAGNIQDVATDEVGNVYLAGYVSATPAEPRVGLLVKYDRGGQELWSRQFANQKVARVSHLNLTIDALGSVYLSEQCRFGHCGASF